MPKFFVASSILAIVADFQFKTSEHQIPTQRFTCNRFMDRGCVACELHKRGDLGYRFWFPEGIPLSVKTQKAETGLMLSIQTSLIEGCNSN
jgi:hypothetical protein